MGLVYLELHKRWDAGSDGDEKLWGHWSKAESDVLDYLPETEYQQLILVTRVHHAVEALRKSRDWSYSSDAGRALQTLMGGATIMRAAAVAHFCEVEVMK